ncbi:MAG TPA: hypothetical protein VG389_06970 [Myxococcota bacterium]|nr:hypothetical protein [Myxococcota bacterium]
MSASLGCGEARALLAASAARPAGVDDASRLRLDEHLAGCGDCRVDRRVVRAVAALQAWEPPALGAAGHDRVLRALEEAALRGAESREGAARSRSPWRWAAVAAAALIVAGVGGAALRGLRGPSGAKAALTVRPLGSAVVKWDGPRAARLVDGAALFEVPPGGGAFSVAAPQFTVHVVGTRFVVSLDGASVLEGVVSVTDAGGALLATLHAGEAWRLPLRAAPAAGSAAGAAAEPAPVATSVHAPALAAEATDDEATAAPAIAVAGAPAAGPAAAVTAAPAPGALLSRARKLLARDPAGARALLAEALARPLKPQLAAEARTLVADSFLFERRWDDALRTYRAVAADFAATPAGDNAAWSAAALDCDRAAGRCAGALRAYLDAYPAGAFVREANDRLAAAGHGGAP